MSRAVASIEKQIASCRALLSLFQTKRQLCADQTPPPLAKIIGLLRHMKEVMFDFETHQGEMRRAMRGGAPDRDENKRQRLTAELGTLLEQLVMLQHENEQVVRRLFAPGNEGAGETGLQYGMN